MKKLLTLALLILCLVVVTQFQVPTTQANPGWWNNDWVYRKSHTLLNATGAGTNYQMNVTVHYGSGSDDKWNVYLDEKCQADFDDIRWLDNDHTTVLDYWLMEKVDSDYAKFWFEVQDDLSLENQTVYLYYGNPDATTTSNAENTFLFFDHFDDADYTDKWTKYGTSTVTESGTEIKLYSASSAEGWLCSQTSFGLNTRAIWKVKYLSTASSHGEEAGFASTDYVERQITGEYIYASYPNFWYRCATGGSATFLSSSFPRDDAYHEVKVMRITGSSAKFQIDDEDVDEITSNIPIGNLPLCLYAWNIASSTYALTGDYVLVTKFVDPEPSHGTWGSEEGVFKYVTFYFNIGGQLRVNNITKTNGTQTPYIDRTVLELVAVPQNESWVFKSFNWTGSSNTTNPALFVITQNETIWLYFADPPPNKGKPPTPTQYFFGEITSQITSSFQKAFTVKFWGSVTQKVTITFKRHIEIAWLGVLGLLLLIPAVTRKIGFAIVSPIGIIILLLSVTNLPSEAITPLSLIVILPYAIMIVLILVKRRQRREA